MSTRHDNRIARGVRAALVAAVIAAGLTLANGAEAGALDQSQTEVNRSETLGEGETRFQTITPAISGRIDRVDVWLAVVNGGNDLTVQIRTSANGVPGSTVLGSASLDAASLVDHAFTAVPFSSGAPVTAGTEYAIAVTSGPRLHSGSEFAWGAHTADLYQRGVAVDEAFDVDFAFATYVDPLPFPRLETPANGSTTTDTTPTFSGYANTELGDDLSVVKIEIYEGVDVTGTLMTNVLADPNDQTGFFTVDLANPLPNGTYVARAVQDGTRGTGAGNQNVFLIDTTGTQPPPAPAGGTPDAQPPGSSDTSKPDTTITSKPFSKTKDRTPTFTFTSNETNVRFECSLDGAAPTPCGSEFTTPKLSRGDHVLLVTAIDRAGNTDPSPARAEFKVKRKRH
jgi:hypothetical protein